MKQLARILSFDDWGQLKAALDALPPGEVTIVTSHEGLAAVHVNISEDALKKLSAALPGLNVEPVQAYHPI